MVNLESSGAFEPIELDQIITSYGSKVALDGLSMKVCAGKITTLLGRNGAGKSTTIDVICGTKSVGSGTCRVFGLDPRTEWKRIAPRVGVMVQQGGVYLPMTPSQTVNLFANYYSNAGSPAELLKTVGITGPTQNTPWKKLSGGEKQRLSLALALIGQPELIILDEPTAGIDPHGQRDLCDLIAQLRSDGKTVLMTTHSLPEAELLSDEVVIIDRGRTVFNSNSNSNSNPADVNERHVNSSSANAAAVIIKLDREPNIQAIHDGISQEAFQLESKTVSIPDNSDPFLLARLSEFFANQGTEIQEIRRVDPKRITFTDTSPETISCANNWRSNLSALYFDLTRDN